MSATIEPKSEKELAQLVGEAAARRQALEIRGGGTRPLGNPVAAACIVETAGLSGIRLYEPGALTLVAAAGTPLEEVDRALAVENQMLPFEAPDWSQLLGGSKAGKSTLGGVVATGAAGPRQLLAGGVRDSLIGVRFVSGEGVAISNGGRVMKNVTGYDLVKLMAGSHGTLGVLTEVSFKLVPKPESTATLVATGLDPAASVASMAKALASPFEVSGAARLPDGEDGPSRTLLRIEGLEASVDYRAARLRDLIAPELPAGAELVLETGVDEQAVHWKAVAAVAPFHDRKGTLWRLALKASEAPALLSAIATSCRCESVLDCGGRLVWLLVEDGEAGSEERIRRLVSAAGGHAMLMRADGQTRATVEAFHPQHQRVEEISVQLRQRFDPAGILNPERMRRNAGARAA